MSFFGRLLQLPGHRLVWLNKAVEHGSYNMTYLAFWPPFDVLRTYPRYHDLVTRVYGQKAEQIRRAAGPGRPQDR